MAITISGENNNDRILAQDGVIDEISGINIVGLLTAGHINVGSNIQLGNAGIVTATTFVGNLTGNVNSTSPLLLQTGGSERFRITSDNALGIAGANYGSSGQVLTSGGSGSAVTWSAIPTQVTIANNADNRVITGGSGVNLNGESSFTYNAGSLIVSNASGNVTQQLNATSGDAKIVLDNSGNGNYSGIDFERERSSGAGVSGGSIFMLSDTSSNNAIMYLQAQSASAQAPVTSALSADNGVRLKLQGGQGIFAIETGAAERLRIDSSGELRMPAGIGVQLRFENQHSVTTDAAISTFDDASGTLLCLGSNFYMNSSGSETRYNTSEESTGIILNRQGYINLNTGGTGATAVNRIQITETGKVQIGLPGATVSLPGATEVVNIRAMAEGNLIIRNIGNLMSAPSGSGVGLDVLNNAGNAVKDLCIRGAVVAFRSATAETLRITSSGSLVVGGQASFGAAGTFSVGANGTFRSILASGTAQDTLIGGISGVSNGFQVTTDASNVQTYKFHSGTSQALTITNNKTGVLIGSPFSRFQCGSHTFSGGHGMYADDRVGMCNAGSLTGLMLQSTYNDASHPEYGLVFVQGPTTSSYNVWSISPDGPAKGNSLNLHYGAQNTNIHSPGNRKFEFDGDGDFSIVDGNLKVASGHGIDFSATGNISGTSSELLDDYEEGSWTPVVGGWDTFTPYSGSSYYAGWYRKVGGMVHCGWKIYIQHLTTPATSGSQHVRISGLPFATASIAAGPIAVNIRFDIAETGITNNIWNYAGGNSTTIYLYKQTNGGNGANAINASSSYTNMWVMGTATYATDS